MTEGRSGITGEGDGCKTAEALIESGIPCRVILDSAVGCVIMHARAISMYYYTGGGSNRDVHDTGAYMIRL